MTEPTQTSAGKHPDSYTGELAINLTATIPAELATQLDSLDKEVKIRSFVRLGVAALAFGALLKLILIWNAWLFSPETPDVLARMIRHSTVIAQANDTVPASPQTDATKETKSEATNYTGIVLLGLLAGTFLFGAWIARDLWSFGARQLRAYFRERERIERSLVARAHYVSKNNRALNELLSGSADPDERP